MSIYQVHVQVHSYFLVKIQLASDSSRGFGREGSSAMACADPAIGGGRSSVAAVSTGAAMSACPGVFLAWNCSSSSAWGLSLMPRSPSTSSWSGGPRSPSPALAARPRPRSSRSSRALLRTSSRRRRPPSLTPRRRRRRRRREAGRRIVEANIN